MLTLCTTKQVQKAKKPSREPTDAENQSPNRNAEPENQPAPSPSRDWGEPRPLDTELIPMPAKCDALVLVPVPGQPPVDSGGHGNAIVATSRLITKTPHASLLTFFRSHSKTKLADQEDLENVCKMLLEYTLSSACLLCSWCPIAETDQKGAYAQVGIC